MLVYWPVDDGRLLLDGCDCLGMYWLGGFLQFLASQNWLLLLSHSSDTSKMVWVKIEGPWVLFLFFGMHTTDWTCINHPSLGYEGTQFWAEKDSAIPWPFRDPQDVLPLQWMPFFQRDLAQSSCDGRWMMWCQKLVRFRLVLRDQRVIQFMATLRGFHGVYALSSLMSGRYCLNYPETCFINFQKGNMAIKIDSSLESSWGPLGPLTNSAYEAHLPAPSSRCLRVWSALKIVETLGGIPSKLWSEHCLVISLKYTQFDEYMI
jgi:hypothetical protein